MFITKEEIKSELKDEECWQELSPKEKRMFLEYCTNGHEEVLAYKEVYVDPQSDRVVKFPGKKAAEILAKQSFSECFEVYSEILREAVSMKANAHLWNQYYVMATWNILDFVDEIGQFKFKDIDEAREQLGIKALAIAGLDVAMHPRDPSKTMTIPKMMDKYKAMKELSRFTKFYGSEEAGGIGLGTISINSQLATVTVEGDEINRRRIGLGEAK